MQSYVVQRSSSHETSLIAELLHPIAAGDTYLRSKWQMHLKGQRARPGLWPLSPRRKSRAQGAERQSGNKGIKMTVFLAEIMCCSAENNLGLQWNLQVKQPAAFLEHSWFAKTLLSLKTRKGASLNSQSFKEKVLKFRDGLSHRRKQCV